MIWLFVIDFIFEGLHNLLTLFGAQWLSNQTIFQYFGNYVVYFINLFDSFLDILEPIFKSVFFFLPIDYMIPLFVILAALVSIRIIVAIAKLIIEFIPFF